MSELILMNGLAFGAVLRDLIMFKVCVLGILDIDGKTRKQRDKIMEKFVTMWMSPKK